MRPIVTAAAAAAAIAVLALPCAPAFAQTETPEPTPAATPEATPMPEATPAPTPPPPAKTPPQAANVSSGAASLKIGGVLWPFYRYDLSETAEDRNGFDLGRAYLNVYPTLGENIDGRLTLDLVRQGTGIDPAGDEVATNTTGSLVVRVKYGYVAYHPLDGVDLIFGMAPTPWNGFEESVWAHRVLAPTILDAFYGVSSSDFGFGAKVTLFGDRLEIHSAVQNGESYSRTERNKYKEIATRATVRVIPAGKGGLDVSGYYGYALNDQDADKVRAVGMVSWRSGLLTAAGGYAMSQLGDGMGTHTVGGGPFGFAYVNLPYGLPGTRGSRVIARADIADPDVDTEDDAVTRAIAGLSLLLHEKSQLILDYQQLSFEAAGADPEQLAFAHWELKF